MQDRLRLDLEVASCLNESLRDELSGYEFELTASRSLVETSKEELECLKIEHDGVKEVLASSKARVVKMERLYEQEALTGMDVAKQLKAT